MMQKPTLAAVSTAQAHGAPASALSLAGFRCAHEEAHTGDTAVPALAFHPDAKPSALAGAACSRAKLLHEALNCWARLPHQDDVTATDVAAHLEPLADELHRVLQELCGRMAAPNVG